MKIVKPEKRKIVLEFPAEVRFTPSGKMVARLYALNEKTHYFLWSENAQLIDQLVKLPSDTVLEVSGESRTRHYEREGEKEAIDIEEFHCRDYRIVHE